MEAQSIEELAQEGEKQLEEIASTGNTVAREWLERIRSFTGGQRLIAFADMKISLMSDTRPEAKIVQKEMFPEQ